MTPINNAKFRFAQFTNCSVFTHFYRSETEAGAGWE